VIPSLDDRELLAASLPPLFAELERRALGDEVVVVDDTGAGSLAAWLATSFPTVHALAREQNGGFAAALRSGVEAAKHALVFCMNPDVVVRRGFLDPLVACLEDPTVHSVTPRVLLNGDESKVESVTEFHVQEGLGRVRQRGLEGEAERFVGMPIPVAYAIGGTCLLRRDEFLANGFDPLFEPFYLEDLDLGWQAWRRGQKVLYQPASIVEHHHRGTIGKRVPRDFVVAVIERNRLAFQWKSIDDPDLLAKHVAALYRMALDAWISDSRDELVWLALALDHMEAALASRAAQETPAASFAEIRRLSSPRPR
jgi:GT2 family glycosyltransferase